MEISKKPWPDEQIDSDTQHNYAQFDYQHQAWTAIEKGQRVYIHCGHPETMDCGCYGRVHAGEIASLTDEQ